MLDRTINRGVFRAQSGDQDGVFSKLVNRFQPLIVFFGKCGVWDFWRGSEYDTGLTNNFLFCTLACPIKVCLQIPFGRGLCHAETNQLICKANRLTGFYMVRFFTGRISEQTTAQFYSWKQPTKSVLLCLYLWWFQTWWNYRRQPVVLFQSSFACIFIQFICTCFTGASFDECFIMCVFH